MKKQLLILILVAGFVSSLAQSADSLKAGQAHPDTSKSSETISVPDSIQSRPDTTLPSADTIQVADSLKKKNKQGITSKLSSLNHPLLLEGDSSISDSTVVRYFQLHNDWMYPTRIHATDSTLNYFNHTNPIYHTKRFHQSLGNPGLAHQNIFFTPNFNTGFDYGQQTFDLYRIDENSVRFYNTYSPYTNLHYVMGPEEQQMLNVTHSQRVYKTLTLGMDIRILNSLGSYPNQESSDRRVAFTGHYVSDNRRYAAQAFYAHNKFDNEENGGIVNDSIFEENIETDRTIYSVNLDNARSVERDARVFLRQSFELSPTVEAASTALEKKKKTPFNFGRLEHKFNYLRRSVGFKDENYPIDYYPAIFKDSTLTNDSSFVRTIENEFSWKNTRLFRTQKSLGFDFGIVHRMIKFSDSSRQRNYNQIELHGRISKNLYKGLKIGGELEYVQGDLNANDFRLSGIITNRFGEDKILLARLDQISRDPSYMFSHYHSNHFRWDRTNDKENIVRINGSFEWNNLEIGGNYYLLTNYTYLNTSEEQITVSLPDKDTTYTTQTIRPEQRAKSFSLLQIYFFPSLRFGNFGWDSYLYFQKASNESALHVPLFAGESNLYYENAVFDNALYLQVGVDVKYKTSYYADKYMPALRSFYLQNEKEIGNFIYANAYASIKIKRTRIVAKYRNATQGLTPYNYYDSPHYPMKDAGFVLGVSWRFHD